MSKFRPIRAEQSAQASQDAQPPQGANLPAVLPAMPRRGHIRAILGRIAREMWGALGLQGFRETDRSAEWAIQVANELAVCRHTAPLNTPSLTALSVQAQGLWVQGKIFGQDLPITAGNEDRQEMPMRINMSDEYRAYLDEQAERLAGIEARLLPDNFRLAVPGLYGTPADALRASGPLGTLLADGGLYLDRLPVPAIWGLTSEVVWADEAPYTVVRLPEHAADIWLQSRSKNADRLTGQFVDRYQDRLISAFSEVLGEAFSIQSARQYQLQMSLAPAGLLADDEVGLAPLSFQRILDELGIQSTAVSGMVIGRDLQMRFPVISDANVVGVRFVCLDDTFRPNQAYCSMSRAVNGLLGDFDGDLQKLLLDAIDGWTVLSGPARNPHRIRIASSHSVEVGRPKDPVTSEEAADLLLGMKVRKALTGIATWFWNVLCILAVRQATDSTPDPEERRRVVRSTYIRMFRIFGPLGEAIFDGFKDTSKLPALLEIASTMEEFLHGSDLPLDAVIEALQVFCGDPEFVATELQELLPVTCSVGDARNTVSRLLKVAGSKTPKESATKARTILRLAVTLAGRDVVEALERDLWTEHRIQPCRLAGDPEEGAVAQDKEDDEPRWRMDTSHQGCWFVSKKGRWFPAYSVPWRNKAGDRLKVEVLRFGDAEKPTIHLQVPTIAARLKGGALVLRGDREDSAARIWRPIVEVQGDEVVRISFLEWWWGLVNRAIADHFSSLFGDTPHAAATFRRKVLGDIRDALRNLPAATAGNRLLAAYEVEVRLLEAETIGEELLEYRRHMRVLADSGLNIMLGSKDEPGSIASVDGPYGVPDYVAAIWPTARFGRQSPKSASEYRGIQDAIELANPTPQHELIRTTLGFPGFLRSRIVLLRVAWIDLEGLNVQGGECAGSVHFCRSADEKLRPAVERIRCSLDAEASYVREMEASGAKLLRRKVVGLDVQWDKGVDGRDPSFVQMSQDVVLDFQHIGPDGGKTKSSGAWKGVQCWSRQLDCEDGPIDCFLPTTVLQKKEGWDAWLLGQLYCAGVQEVLPGESWDDLLAKVQHLRPQEIRDEDGTVLGTAWVGWLPFYRDDNTSARYATIHRHHRAMELHTRLMTGWEQPESPQQAEERGLANRLAEAISTIYGMTGSEGGQDS